MNMIWLCVASLLSLTAAISHEDIIIRVFPADNRTVAGVFQVSLVDDVDQLQYAFNASEARELCVSLGVEIASKAQVQDALARGLETCRFGWIDEHFAVIPRIKALSNCGQNKTGLVSWRTDVSQKFDVFCFNEADKAADVDDTTSLAPSESTDTTPSASSAPVEVVEVVQEVLEGEVVRFVGSAQSSSGGKTVLITSTCILLLIAVIVIAYIKVRRRSGSSDRKQQEEDMETEEWACVKNMKEPAAAVEDERIEVGNTAS